ncbi:class I SAM-dependent methyltransferase [Crossiella sp. NPDC003009]
MADYDSGEWLARLRQHDELTARTHRTLAGSLVTGSTEVVLDIGCGAGGMSAHLARALAARGGGTLVLFDTKEELLRVAATHAQSDIDPAVVKIEKVPGDLADAAVLATLPRADLVWASRVVHHLPDQQRAVDDLAALLRPGGTLALVEGGLPIRVLPWDLGFGTPGLEERLAATRDAWFHRLRQDLDGAVPLPYGWNLVLTKAGLTGVTARSFITDHPAPLPEPLRAAVVHRLNWLKDVTIDALSETDRTTLLRLLDPADEAYVANREDTYWLAGDTVHLGSAPS